MKWLLIERKPAVIYAGRPETFLARDGGETHELSEALTFSTKAEAEAHRRRLTRPYNWVSATVRS